MVCVCVQKKFIGALRDGSVGKELACKHKGVSLISRSHVQISGCALLICNLEDGKAETGRYPGLALST